MDSTVFKYKHHYEQQNHHFNSNNNNNNNNSNHYNNNQNSIFILNTTTNNILPTNQKLYCSDFNDNNNVLSPSSSSTSSSVWSSASSTMCSPAAHAIQKLFNCSSNSLKLNQGNFSGIESKTFKSKSELLKKKSKFWKYLEGEANDNNNQRGIVNEMTKKDEAKSQKRKTKYWVKSFESDNQNCQDLSELLEYSCSLCDNCQCMDCQIGYFDCDYSDDSNSEYSFHLSAYDEDDDDGDDDDDVDDAAKRNMELKIPNVNYNSLHKMDNKQQHAIHKFDSKSPSSCVLCCSNEANCTNVAASCQQCSTTENQVFFLTNPDH